MNTQQQPPPPPPSPSKTTPGAAWRSIHLMLHLSRRQEHPRTARVRAAQGLKMLSPGTLVLPCAETRPKIAAMATTRRRARDAERAMLLFLEADCRVQNEVARRSRRCSGCGGCWHLLSRFFLGPPFPLFPRGRRLLPPAITGGR